MEKKKAKTKRGSLLAKTLGKGEGEKQGRGVLWGGSEIKVPRKNF